MSIKVFALHGNPGFPSDWERVRREIPKDYELIALDLNRDPWLKTVLREESKFILVGFSWSCYEILRNSAKLAGKVEKLVLIAPYLKPQNPLSGLAQLLIQTPVVGSMLLKKSHANSIEEFTDRMLSPFNDGGVRNEVREKLRKDWTLWRKAAYRKIEQQGEPLTPQHGAGLPGFILHGRDDRSAPWSTQESTAKMFPQLKVELLEGAGHGLLWSHPKQIADLITRPAPAPHIGYHFGRNPRNNVTSYMDQHLTEHPDRIALRWVSPQDLKAWSGDPKDRLPHQQIPYSHFAQRINSLATGLKSIGIQAGDRVIIFLPMSLDMYTAMFAVQKIGAIAVFLDSWARSHHLGASAECVGPKAMVSFKQAFDLVNQVPEFKSMPLRIMYGPGEGATHRFEELLQAPTTQPEPVESETSALITFTTGSTGKPKGANRTHRFLSAQHIALDHVIPYTEKDTDMPAFPIFSLNNLAAGVTTILPAVDLAAPSARDSAALASQILNENITCTTLSPSMLVNLARFCQENKITLSGLRRVVTGGAPISKDDVRAFYAIAPQTEIWILYGSTEAEPMAHIEGREMLALEVPSDPEIIESGVNVGHISEDVDFKFIRIQRGPIELKNDNWQEYEIPTGQVGEFIVTGDHVCREYYNNPEAFKTTKILDGQGRVWHRTGDLGYLDEKKNLWLVGRVNNVIVRGGEYFFPVQAEILLKRLPFAYRSAFLGLPHDRFGESTCAVIELKGDVDRASFDRADAEKEIQRVFSKNKIPVDTIRFIEKIPMDPRHHSKVEYGVLRQQLLAESPA